MEFNAQLARLEEKIDRNSEGIKEVSRKFEKLHHVLVGNGDPRAIYVRLLGVENSVDRFRTMLEEMKRVQDLKMNEFEATLIKQDERLDKLEKLEANMRGRIYGAVAVASFVWSVVVLLLGWLVFK